jgi:hypothetical protein
MSRIFSYKCLSKPIFNFYLSFLPYYNLTMRVYMIIHYSIEVQCSALYFYTVLGYNDFDLFDKMKPPRPLMVAKFNSKTHL